MITKKSFKRFIYKSTLITSLIFTLTAIDMLLTKLMPINISVLIAVVSGALYVVFARVKSEYEYWENKKIEQE